MSVPAPVTAGALDRALAATVEYTRTGQQAVQLHGAIGVSDELGISHYFKRLMAIELQFGSTDWHPERYAAQLR